MLPSGSIAGLVTGCRLSAIGTATLTTCGLLTCPLAETLTGPEVAPSGTRATTKSSELITIAPSTSLKRTRGRFSSAGRKLLPLIRISPPGRADAGETLSMCGLPLTFFFPNNRSEIPMRFIFLARFRSGLVAEEAEMQKELHDSQAIKPGRDIVNHDPDSFRQPFQLPHRVWFYDIEGTKKYKARQKRFPRKRGTKKRHQLASGFIDHDELRVLDSGSAGYGSGGRYAEGDSQNREEKVGWKDPCGRKQMGNYGPEDQGGQRSPRPGTRFQAAGSEKSGDERGPEGSRSLGGQGFRCPMRSLSGFTRHRDPGVGNREGIRRQCRERARKSHIGRSPICRDRSCGTAHCRKESPGLSSRRASCKSGNATSPY